MTALPDFLTPDDEIEVTWARDELSTRVTTTLGDASVVVECVPESAQVIPFLLSAMPQILEKAWAAIESEDNEADEESAAEEEQ